MKWPVKHSLRARLLFFLLAAILLTAFLQGWAAYRGALVQADEIFDYHLQRTAFSLSTGNPIFNMPGESNNFDGPEDHDLVIQVWTPDGVRVFRSAPHLPLPDRTVLGFSDLHDHGATYRVFSLETPTQVIQVAQGMTVRTDMASAMALRAVWPIAAMAPLLMLIVWWVVSMSLTSVNRARQQVAVRQPDDLSPIGEEDLPDEVRPLVHELNLLLGRVNRAFAAQQQFVGDAAHELRSPLAALKLQIQSLQRAGDETSRDTATRRLAGGIDRAVRLVDQLLLLARQEAGANSIAPMTKTALNEAVHLAINDVLPLAQAKSINLGVVRSDTALVDGNLEELVIMTRNLLDNAIKYTPADGRVDIAIIKDSVGVNLLVDDSGPGIQDDHTQRVFDRFYRTGDTSTTGSGLGLAIVKAITDKHGAVINLQRSPDLGGLRATVRFPQR
jgi:two-component system OmpR family sensor kinase